MDFLPIPSLIFSSSLESEALRTMYGYVFWLECFPLRLDLAGSRFLFLRQQPMSSPVIYPTFCIIPRAQLTYSRWAVPSSRFEMPLLKSEKNASFLEWTLCWKLLFGTPNSFISTFLLKNLNKKKKFFRTELFSYSLFFCFDCFWLGYGFATLWGVMSHCPLLFLTCWYKSMRFCYVHIFWSVKKLI